MASAIQIVPKGQYPHVETFIYDNTEVYDTPAVETDDTIKTIHVFRSGKGIDNKIVKMKDQKSFKNVFGPTDYKKYGQALMMPYASLGSGYTSVYCMRVMPDDATYANSGVYVYYRTANVTVSEGVVDENGDPVYGDDGITQQTKDVQKQVFQVMFRSKSFAPTVDTATNKLTDGTSAVHTVKEMDALIKAGVEDIEATDEGNSWTCLPLIKFNSTGRGVYGNNYKWRITKNAEYEKDYERKIYTFEVMSAENGLEKIATYVGSLVTSVINNESMLVDDIISEYDAGEYPVNIGVYEESVEAVYDAYVEFLTGLAEDTGVELEVPEIDEFDLLFGLNLNSSSKYEYFQAITPDNDSYPIPDDEYGVSMGNDIGVYLNGGHDGSFGTFIDTEKKTTINGALEKLSTKDYNAAVTAGITHLKFGEATVEDYMYAKAYSGILDKAILSVRRTPADYLLDANYSYYTKISLAQFAIARADALCYIDTGIEYDTFSNAVIKNIAKLYGGIFANRIISLNGHSWKVSDPFTQRKVVVSATHFIASELPKHWKTNGIQTPFAKAYARIVGHAKNSIVPAVDLHEADLMDTLANMRLNYVEAIGENVFQRGIQNTAQTINSDLTEESNMHVLLWLKRNIEKDVFDNLYNFANASERATFRQIEAAKYEHIIGSLVHSFDIKFDMNEWESDRQILHCYVEVQFRTLMKRAIIEIDVNRRDYAA